MNQSIRKVARITGYIAVGIFGLASTIATNHGGGGGGGGSTGGGSSGGATAPTYTKIDCDPANIAITASSRQTSVAGNQYSQRIDITVKCSGNPVQADVKLEVWYGDPIKRTTDATTGQTRWTNRVHADGSGETYKVTVWGTDADGDAEPVTKTFNFPAP